MKIEIRNVDIGTALSIFMTFKPGGYALFLIDEQTGTLAIVSDWGKWQHMWGGGPRAWGTKTFVEFLAGRDAGHCNYLTDKLHYGRTRMVIDGDATQTALEARLREVGRMADDDSTMIRYLADLRTLTHRLDGKDPNEFWHCWGEVDSALRDLLRNEPIHECIETRWPSSMTFLNEQILPAFVTYLQGYLDGKHASADQLSHPDQPADR
jgi:hypothetical protein